MAEGLNDQGRFFILVDIYLDAAFFNGNAYVNPAFGIDAALKSIFIFARKFITKNKPLVLRKGNILHAMHLANRICGLKIKWSQINSIISRIIQFMEGHANKT